MTHIDQSHVVALPEIVQDGRLVQICKVGHVLRLLELGRVYLGEVVLFQVAHLMGASRCFPEWFLVYVCVYGPPKEFRDMNINFNQMWKMEKK